MSEQFSNILNAFPKRRMAILATGKQNIFFSIGLAFLFVILEAGLLYMTAPDLMYDYKVAKDPVIDTQAEIHGSCKTRKLVFVDCDVKIKYLPTPEDKVAKEIKHSLWFVSFQPSLTTDAVRSKSDPTMITTTIATEHLTNRFIMMLSFFLLFAALVIGCIYSAMVSFAFTRIARMQPALKPLIVHVTKIHNERNVNFEAIIDGVKKKFSNIMRKKDEPLFLSNQDSTALAFAISGSKHVVLLDENLSVLDFTEQEREALRAAIAA